MDLHLEKLMQWHRDNHQKLIKGRYINLDQIKPLIDDLPALFKITVLGHSEEERPIHRIQMGQGRIKVLMWSQMHGNESTTTKAVFDLFKALDRPSNEFDWVLENFTIVIIPMLNPDGAEAYTRVNAANIDLNRDAKRQTQPESQVLNKVFTDFKPDYCFNLHGQRTIYGFQDTGKPSILSFLAPSSDEDRSITIWRKRSMQIITYISNQLSPDLEGSVGRYDDGFNINCTGDSYMAAGVPTILFEAGHYPDDYGREQTRAYVFSAIVLGLQGILKDDKIGESAYFEIPEHQKCYFDIILRNSQGDDLAIQYEELLESNRVVFMPKVAQIGSLEYSYGHKEVQIAEPMIVNDIGDQIQIGEVLMGLGEGSSFAIAPQ